MKFIIGRKLEMSQRYRPSGEVVPVTLVKVEPCVITQVKTADKDGYTAVQVGTGFKKHLAKPQMGHLKAAAEPGNLATLREFRLDSVDGMAPGAVCDMASFASGDVIDVTGISKGKGFAGVVKRHHFAGGPGSHGQKDNLRMPGSIGGGGRNGKGRVVKGMRMAGRMGGDQVTVKHLEIVEVRAEQGLVAVKGAVPGARGATLLIVAPQGDMKFITAKTPAEEAPVAQEAAPATEAAAVTE
jgi:large subunit ribosomal protein L3